jgi:hypothetical protein
MNQREQQQQEEFDVFLKFAAACPLPILVNAATNRPDPEPDILCGLCCGEMLAFELVQAEDVTTYTNANGKVRVASIQEKESKPGVHFSVVSPSIVDKVKKKLDKNYETDHPIHLLAWSDTALIRELPFWQDDLRTLLTNGMGQFKRVWVFGRTEKVIVFDSNEHV